MSQKERLQGIADAIREKKGTTEKIKAVNFETEIRENLVYTADATATADDIIKGKTAYVNGEKIEGVGGISLKSFIQGRNCNYLFYGYKGTSVDEFLEYDYTSDSTNMGYMFQRCTNLTTVPLFDTSKVTNMTYMFYSCTNLTTVPLFDTSKVTNMTYMFGYCTNLTTVPLFDTSKVTDMNYMFGYCTNLTTVPLFDTSKVTNTMQMFQECTNLTTVPQLDMRAVKNIGGMGNMFKNCTALTGVWIRNIKTHLTVGSGTTYGHLLTVDSLIHLVKELRDAGSKKTLTMGTANLEKVASVYVKQIEITDEMRAEDDLIDEKLACEVCESTDEGAMLLEDFAALKNWALA